MKRRDVAVADDQLGVCASRLVVDVIQNAEDAVSPAGSDQHLDVASAKKGVDLVDALPVRPSQVSAPVVLGASQLDVVAKALEPCNTRPEFGHIPRNRGGGDDRDGVSGLDGGWFHVAGYSERNTLPGSGSRSGWRTGGSTGVAGTAATLRSSSRMRLRRRSKVGAVASTPTITPKQKVSIKTRAVDSVMFQGPR